MDKYEKLRIIGRGAYGIVHLCKRLSDDRLLIIKKIPLEDLTAEGRQAALKEVTILSMLAHPNIIEYFENFLDDKALNIVMEFAEGGTMFDFLQQQNGNLLSEEKILHSFVQMLLALHHVHSKQILHRDLKTQNILLDKKKEVVKIGDFGISQILLTRTKAVTVVGTPCYISPELCESKPYNQKSDIWALGCILYELVTLRRAFEAPSLPALVLKIMRGARTPISENYSTDLRDLIDHMLQLDPTKRPTINEIMARPFILKPLIFLYTDLGMIPCTRVIPEVAGVTNKIENQKSSDDKKESILQITSKVFLWGDGATVPIILPLPTSDIQIKQVAVGRTQKTAITKNGRLLLWQINETTLLSDIQYIPHFLEGQSALSIIQVACGDLFTACLTDRGILMTYGSGVSGCLGHGNYLDSSQAKIVESLLGYEVVQLACGASHIMISTNENELYSWGRGENGRLGLNSKLSYNTPQKVQLPSNLKIRSIICGLDRTIILTLDYQIWATGNNRNNKLALNSNNDNVNEVWSFTKVVDPVLEDLEIVQISCGHMHTAALTTDGKCYCFGSNAFGQLGLPNQNVTIVKMSTLDNFFITHISAGDAFTVASTNDCQIFTWGKSGRGRLGRHSSDLIDRIDLRSTLNQIIHLSSSLCTTILAVNQTT